MGTRDIIAYSVATLIAGLVVLLLFQSYYRAQNSSIAATQVRASRTSVFNLAHMLQRDLRNMGANHPCEFKPDGTTNKPYFVNINSVISAPPQFDGTEGSFAFLAQAERCQPPVVIRYEWTKEGVAILERGNVDLFSVRRLVAGSLTGFTGPTISRLEFEFLGSDGLPAGALTSVRQVRVELRSVSPLGTSDLMEESLWSAIIHPIAMSLEDWLASES